MGFSLSGFDRLRVDIRPPCPDLDEHGAEPTLPEVVQSAINCQGRVGLEANVSAGESLWGNGAIHGSIVWQAARMPSAPKPDSSQPRRYPVDLGAVVLAKRVVHDRSSMNKDCTFIQPYVQRAQPLPRAPRRFKFVAEARLSDGVVAVERLLV